MLVEKLRVYDGVEGEGIRTSPQPNIDCNRSEEEKVEVRRLVVGHLAGQTAAPPLEAPANAIPFTLNRAAG